MRRPKVELFRLLTSSKKYNLTSHAECFSHYQVVKVRPVLAYHPTLSMLPLLVHGHVYHFNVVCPQLESGFSAHHLPLH